MGQPVPIFDHSRRSPLIVFAAFADDAITHVAMGKKGGPGSGGTGMIRLNMRELVPLEKPVRFEDIAGRTPPQFKAHVTRVLATGGLLPNKSLGAVIENSVGDRTWTGRTAWAVLRAQGCGLGAHYAGVKAPTSQFRRKRFPSP